MAEETYLSLPDYEEQEPRPGFSSPFFRENAPFSSESQHITDNDEEEEDRNRNTNCDFLNKLERKQVDDILADIVGGESLIEQEAWTEELPEESGSLISNPSQLSETEESEIIVTGAHPYLVCATGESPFSVESQNSSDEDQNQTGTVSYSDEPALLNDLIDIEFEQAARTKESAIFEVLPSGNSVQSITLDSGTNVVEIAPSRRKSLQKVNQFSGCSIEFVEPSTSTQENPVNSVEKPGSSKGFKRRSSPKQKQEKKPKLYNGDPRDPRVARSVKVKKYRDDRKQKFIELVEENKELTKKNEELMEEVKQLKSELQIKN